MTPIVEDSVVSSKQREGSLLARAARYWNKIRYPAAGDHGAQRWRKIFISLGSTFASRVLAQGCNLLMIPIALRYLGAERFGVWVTLTSAVGLLSFFDFGIGVGLQNRVAEMMGKERLDQLGQCLRSTLLVLTSISLLVYTIVVLLIFHTSLPSSIFHGEHFGTINLREVLAIIAGAFMLGLPLGLFPRIAFGLQQGWIASVLATGGTLFGLIAIVIASIQRVEFTTFVAFSVVPPIAAQAAGYFLLARRIPGGLPLLGSISVRDGFNTLKQGTHYVLPQITGAILMQGPMIFLGTHSSALNAATYSILTRIGMPFQQLQQMFLAQIWPAITEALHRGDNAWLKKTLPRVLRTNLLFGILATLLVTAAILLLFPLLAKNIALQPTLSAILLYAGLTGITCVVQGLASIANGLGRMRSQNYLALVSMLFAFVVLPLTAASFGVAGVLIAMLVLNAFVTLPFLYWEYTSYLEKTKPTIARPVSI